MIGLLVIIGAFVSEKIKAIFEPTIPAENWANKDLYHEDMMNGVSPQQLSKNLRNGKYKLTENYPEPHRDENGKIIIENYKLYNEDVKNHGAYQAHKWVQQGKYNLTPEELEKQHEEFERDWEHLYSLLSDGERKEESLEEKRKKEAEILRIQQAKQDVLIKEQQKKEEERLRIQRAEQEMLVKQQQLIDECQKILFESGYTNVNISFPLKKTGVDSNYGYISAKIVTKKQNEDFSVSFSSSDILPFKDGHRLLKSLTIILSSVDISNFDNRESKLKEIFEVEGLKLQETHQDFELSNGSLAIAVDCYDLNHKVLIKFYTSKINIKQLNVDTMNGHEFEHFCAELLKKNGYEKINVTQGSGDQGIDIIAIRDGIKYGIQCKCYSSDIGNKAVQEVFAGKAFYECHIGVVLTNQFFTKSAIELAKKNGVILWDRNKLLELIKKSTD